MAELANDTRNGLLRKFMAQASARRKALPCDKATLRSAVAVADAWIEANIGLLDAELARSAKGTLDADLRNEMLLLVIGQRQGER